MVTSHTVINVPTATASYILSVTSSFIICDYVRLEIFFWLLLFCANLYMCITLFIIRIIITVIPTVQMLFTKKYTIPDFCNSTVTHA